MNKKYRFEKIISILLAMVLCISVVGCEKNNVTEPVSQQGETDKPQEDTKAEAEESKSEENAEKVMGRYKETMISFTEWGDFVNGITQMEDGSLAIIDSSFGKYVSKDNGDTWEMEELSWINQFRQKAYIQSSALSNDGYIAIEYMLNEQREKNGDTQQPSESEDIQGIDWKHMLVSPDGTEIAFGEDLKDVNSYCFSNQGELYVLSKESHKIYKVDKESGKAEEMLDVIGENLYFSVYDNILVAINHEGIAVYDLTKKEKIEDKVLDDFYKTNLKQFDYYAGHYYSGLILQTGENMLYLASRDGMFRHIIGGSKMEQIMEGNLNSFSNPSISFLGMTALADNAFVVLFTGGQAAKYVYDPNISAVPEIQLKAYSLRKNESLQQAITLFQQKYPEAYVKYEVALEKGSALTKEDALKTLNTEIAAGKGPDIIVLDNLPINSYIEKGVLTDLSPYLKELEKTEPLIANIRDTYKKNDKIYAVPTRFKVPAIVGNQDVIQGIDTIEKLADVVEKLRSENPKGQIIGSRLPLETLIQLGTVYGADWQMEDGSIHQEGISEFLTQAKRIYEADIAGITQEDIDKSEELYGDTIRNGDALTGEKYDHSYMANLSPFYMVAGDSLLSIGYLDGSQHGLSSVSSYMESSVLPNLDFTNITMNGKSVYTPFSVVGILNSSSAPEMAGELLTILMSKENQDLTTGGFSINKQSFEQLFIPPASNDESDRITGGMSGLSLSGKEVVVDINIPQEPWLNQCKAIVETADKPNLTEGIVKEMVIEKGAEALNGTITVQQAVKEIMSKLEIYMAE